MENALTQTLVAGLVVLAAVAFLARRAWRSFVSSRRASAKGATCDADGGCGCAPGQQRDPESLTTSGRG
jgi:hypothetical protein